MARIFLTFLIFPLLLFFAISGIGNENASVAKSAYTHRHSGLEAPGEPRKLDILPGRQAVRTPEGGMGYTDAYGRTVQAEETREETPKRRLRSGAFGAQSHVKSDNSLPDPQPEGKPVWEFK